MEIVMEKINLYEALLQEQEDKDDFYRDRVYDELNNFISSTIKKDTTKRSYLLQIENLISKMNKIYKKLIPKYKEYIKAFDLKKVVPVENVKYEDFKVVQNLSNLDLLDYADFIKSGGNTPKKVLFNLNTMNEKQIELTMYIQFMNSLIYHTRINFIYDLKSKGFDLFVALNNDIDGMLLLVTTDWYLKFFDEDEFNAKWRAFKKLRVADYQNANCLVSTATTVIDRVDLLINGFNLLKGAVEKKIQLFQNLCDDFKNKHDLKLEYVTGLTIIKEESQVRNYTHPINFIGAETLFGDWEIENNEAKPLRAILDILFNDIYVLNKYPHCLEFMFDKYWDLEEIKADEWQELYYKIDVFRQILNENQKRLLDKICLYHFIKTDWKYNIPNFSKEMLFKFENKFLEDEIEFEKKWLRNCNSMFWSSPDKFKLQIKNIIAIALNNNSSLYVFSDLYLLFGFNKVQDGILYLNINNNSEISNVFLNFNLMCLEIFEETLKNSNKLTLKKSPLNEEDFRRITYTKIYNKKFYEATPNMPLQMMYELSQTQEYLNLDIQRKIKEYISDCFLADLKSLQQ